MYLTCIQSYKNYVIKPLISTLCWSDKIMLLTYITIILNFFKILIRVYNDDLYLIFNFFFSL